MTSDTEFPALKSNSTEFFKLRTAPEATKYLQTLTENMQDGYDSLSEEDEYMPTAMNGLSAFLTASIILQRLTAARPKTQAFIDEMKSINGFKSMMMKWQDVVVRGIRDNDQDIIAALSEFVYPDPKNYKIPDDEYTRRYLLVSRLEEEFGSPDGSARIKATISANGKEIQTTAVVQPANHLDKLFAKAKAYQ